jgi:hypothetical protein
MADSGLGQRLRFTLRVQSESAGAPLRWDVDLDQLPGANGLPPAGWIDPDSWLLQSGDRLLPHRVDADTLDGRRFIVRFRAPLAGPFDITATCAFNGLPRPAPGLPPNLPTPLIGAGEALGFGSRASVGDLHVGLQTAVDLVDWFGRGERDLLLTCHLHEGGAFLYSAMPGGGDSNAAAARSPGGAWPPFRRVGRLPGFGDDGQGYNGRLRAVDFQGNGRFDLLECRRADLWWRRNIGAAGAPAFAPAVPLPAGGGQASDDANIQSLCPLDLEGDGRISLLVGTNDWSAYWPSDVSAWGGQPGYRPFEADGTWRGGPLRGRLYLLRNISPPVQGSTDAPPQFAAPQPLCHDDGTPLEVYGLAGPAVIPAANPAAAFDLLVSDFLDRIWYFRNTGRRGPDGAPCFAQRTPVRCTQASPPLIDRPPTPPAAAPPDYPPEQRLPDELILPTCMHALTVAPRPGEETSSGGEQPFDLIVGAEDGYVRLLRWAGRTADGVPIVEPPIRLQEYGAHLSVGAKACPNVVDWDGDGRPELVIGNAAGQVLLARTSAAASELRFSAPEPILAEGNPLWMMAGTPGTIQGPSEVKWGYINPGVGVWSPPGRRAAAALVCGDALGQNTLYLRMNERSAPAMADTPGGADWGEGPNDSSAQPVARVSRGRRMHILRDGRWQPLVTRWRCRPQLVDWGDGTPTYVQVDEAGVVSRYCLLADGPDSEFGTVRVALHGPLLYADGAPVKLDAETGGSVGRIKLAIADWDADGLPDLLVGTNGNHPPGLNSLRKATVWLLRNIGQPGQPVFTPPEMLGLEAGMPARFGGHSCVPAPCSFAADAEPATGRPDLLVGSENGRVYAFRRSYIDAAAHLLSVEMARDC